MAKAQILIAEDDAIIAMGIEMQLKELGYGVTAMVGCGEDAVEEVKENTPDVVLMDIVLLGEMDGIEAADQIRTQFDIPVIFLTGFADKDRLERAKLTYPFGFILKPFQPNDLEVTIEMALYVAKVDRERKQAEEALRKSESQLLEAQSVANIGSWSWDLQTNKLFWSEENYRIFGLSPEVLPSYENFEKTIHPDDLDFVNKSVEDALERKKPYNSEFRIILPDNKVGFVHSIGKVEYDKENKPLRFFGTVQNITNRKRAEEEKDKLLKAIETTKEAINIVSPEGLISYANNAMDELFGYKQGELIEKDISILNADSVLETTVNEIMSNLEKKGWWEGEVLNKRKDGTEFITFATVSATKDQHGQITNIISTQHDVTERKQAEEALRQAQDELEQRVEERTAELAKANEQMKKERDERKRTAVALRLYEEIIENMAEGVCLIRTSDGVIVYTNPRFERMFGYGSEELKGKHVSIVNAPTERTPVETAKEIIQNLEEKGFWSGKVENIKKDGTRFWCHANVSTFDHHDFGEVWVSVQEDITESKQKEE